MTSDTRHDPLAVLSAQGVVVWLDDLSRELLASGELQSLITRRHVVGVTTNPTIFASAQRDLGGEVPGAVAAAQIPPIPGFELHPARKMVAPGSWHVRRRRGVGNGCG